MAIRGMGVIYTRTAMGQLLRAQPDPVSRKSILDRWYWPHHSKLERTVGEVTTRSGSCLIIDRHSFPSVALPYEVDQIEKRAGFCVGTNPFHTPSLIRDVIIAALRESGYSVTIDAPFSGAVVPLAFFQKDHRVRSVMIEVNRRLYMDESSGLKVREFDRVRVMIGQLIVKVSEAAG